VWFGGWTLRELAIDGTRQNGVGPKPDCDVDGRPNRGTLLVEVAEPDWPITSGAWKGSPTS